MRLQPLYFARCGLEERPYDANGASAKRNTPSRSACRVLLCSCPIPMIVQPRKTRSAFVADSAVREAEGFYMSGV